MRRRDRKQWRAARTLAELGKLTARWLEGDLASQPGYQANCGPERETRELIPTLAALNRAGFLTDCSQPSEEATEGYDGAVWCQRAAVCGFAEPAVAQWIADAAGAAGLWVHITTAGRDRLSDRIVVTTRDGKPVTGVGGRRSPRDLAFQYAECNRTAIKAICDALQVTVVDPEWGRNTVLWPLLEGTAFRWRWAIAGRSTNAETRGGAMSSEDLDEITENIEDGAEAEYWAAREDGASHESAVAAADEYRRAESQRVFLASFDQQIRKFEREHGR